MTDAIFERLNVDIEQAQRDPSILRLCSAKTNQIQRSKGFLNSESGVWIFRMYQRTNGTIFSLKTPCKQS
jgi:hypothetical protein